MRHDSVKLKQTQQTQQAQQYPWDIINNTTNNFMASDKSQDKKIKETTNMNNTDDCFIKSIKFENKKNSKKYNDDGSAMRDSEKSNSKAGKEKLISSMNLSIPATTSTKTKDIVITNNKTNGYSLRSEVPKYLK